MTDVAESENAKGSALYDAGAAGAVNRVFISYASQDVAVAEKLCAALEAASLLCWIAPRDVRAGESYAAAIVRAINSCRMLVLVLSKSAIESSHVLREIERASSKNRPVLTVRVDAVHAYPATLYLGLPTLRSAASGHANMRSHHLPRLPLRPVPPSA